MITLQHCWASIKADDMFDCSAVVFNGGEGFLFVVNEAVSDAHVSLPWNHCLLQIQRNSLMSKQFAISLHDICNQVPCSALILTSKNTSTHKSTVDLRRSGNIILFY